jgi:hypothetical protein
MVIRLVARVDLESLAPHVIYPRDEKEEERIALLTGIVQLVSAALERSGTSSTRGQLMFMKSDRGVIGYCAMKDEVFICEGDAERETGDALKAVVKKPKASDEELSESIDEMVKKRGKEIGDLWR